MPRGEGIISTVGAAPSAIESVSGACWPPRVTPPSPPKRWSCPPQTHGAVEPATEQWSTWDLGGGQVNRFPAQTAPDPTCVEEKVAEGGAGEGAEKDEQY